MGSIPTIDEIFGPGGLMEQSFPNYEKREGQFLLTKRIEQCFNSQDFLMAEAPTGTGKAQSYLVPAVRYAATHKKSDSDEPTNIFIATANIALQEQLINKDLPLVKKITGIPFEYMLLKGRANYVCKWLLDKSIINPDVDLDGKDLEQFHKMQEWADTTRTGDVSELTFVPQSKVKRLLTIDSDECQGSDCAYFNDCYYNLLKRKASSIHVIVVNYHLLLTHFKVLHETGKNLILPSVDMVVFDESHRLPGIARDFFGDRVGVGAVIKVGGELDRIGARDIHDELRETAQSFFNELTDFYERGGYSARLKSTPPIPCDPLLQKLQQVDDTYKHYLDTNKDKENAADPTAFKAIEKIRGRTATLKARIDVLYHLKNPEHVVFLEREQTRLYLRSMPINIGPLLKEWVFNKVSSAVLCSATMRADGGTYDYIKKEVGLPEASTLTVESPFDLKRQMMFCAPLLMPEPNDPGYRNTGALVIKQAVELSRGRALCLFTSYASLNAAYDKLKDLPFNILKQGDKPVPMLIDEFKKDVHSILLGTDSFWEGIDVPGEALSLVVIDRLPFAPKDDPLVDILGREGFRAYSLPLSVIKLRQAVGRLIRSKTDRGVVLLLDPRLTDKKKNYSADYRVHFSSAIVKGVEAIEGFLADDGKRKSLRARVVA